MSLLETFMQGFLNIPACKSDTEVSKCPCSTEPDVTVATQIIPFSKNGCCRTELGPGCFQERVSQQLSVCV